ncbi:MAG TPA: radical SAM protein [Myxococcota bacterium]|nr:radical SAM protein [Myxococcota bacterium]HND32034.1 radical SAM protein [Myxococcota bacterium]
MWESLKQRLSEGGRIQAAEAEALWKQASDAELMELAGIVRARYHRPNRATYLIMAIVNYTNVCVARCDYCAFYKMPGQTGTYLLSFEQVCGLIDAVRALGGEMVGFNGGFHPDLGIEHYTDLFSRVRARYPEMTFYEMTVAEFMFVAKRNKVPYAEAAKMFADCGTRWITGGGSEILVDSFRLRHSPGKYKVEDYYAAQQAILDAGMGSTGTMVIGFDESLDERLAHLERLRRFQDENQGRLSSFLCWTYKPYHTELGGQEVPLTEYLRWLAICRIYLDNIVHIRTSVLTRNQDALLGIRYGANDFDLPTEDEVTRKAGATISHDFEQILDSGRALGLQLERRPALLPWSARGGDIPAAP